MKEVSRQRRWQIRKKASGRCVICGEKVFKSDRCTKHYWLQLARKRVYQRKRKGHGVWRKGGRGRPPIKIPEGMAK